MRVKVLENSEQLGHAAALHSARVLNDAIQKKEVIQ